MTLNGSYQYRRHRPDLTLENAIVLDNRWAHIFTGEDRRLAQQKLREL